MTFQKLKKTFPKSRKAFPALKLARFRTGKCFRWKRTPMWRIRTMQQITTLKTRDVPHRVN